MQNQTVSYQRLEHLTIRSTTRMMNVTKDHGRTAREVFKQDQRHDRFIAIEHRHQNEQGAIKSNSSSCIRASSRARPSFSCYRSGSRRYPLSVP